MAKPRSFILSCYALCFLLIILSNQEMARPAEALKKCYSQKWRGTCISDSNCERTCMKKEHAKGGECQFDGSGRACFCYF